jgi:hypothetical protein
MFNLLPPSEKQNILKEYSSRRLILSCIFLCALGLISVASLAPSYLLSRARISELTDDLERSRGTDIAKELESQTKIIATTNAKLGILADSVAEHKANNLFQDVISKRGSGIRISALMYKRGGDKETGSISVTGIARDRESLSRFVQDLKTNTLYSKVDLPVSSFAKDKNTNFTIQLFGKF